MLLYYRYGMVAYTSCTGIHEQVTMKRGSGTSSSAVVAKKTSNPERKSNEENGKNIGKEAVCSISVSKINDGTGKSKLRDKSKGHMLQTKNEPASAKKEESKRGIRSQNKEKKSKTSGNKSGMSQDSSRNKRKEISQKKSKSENKIMTYSPSSSLDDGDLDFSAIEQKIFEGFPLGKRSGRGNSLTKDKTKKEIVSKSSLLSSEEEKKRRTAIKEKSAHENKNKFHESSQVTKTHVGKRESKNMGTLSKCSKLKGANKGKTRALVSNTKKKNKAELKKESTGAASDSGMSDWEEVDEMEGVDEVKELLSGSHVTKAKSEGVQIELDAPDVLWGIRRRKRRTEEEMVRIQWLIKFKKLI